MDTVVLHFVKQMCAKGMPVKQYAMQVKAPETLNSFRITNFKAGQCWCEKFMCHEGATQSLNTHLSKDSNWFSREAAKLPVISYFMKEETKLCIWAYRKCRGDSSALCYVLKLHWWFYRYKKLLVASNYHLILFSIAEWYLRMRCSLKMLLCVHINWMDDSWFDGQLGELSLGKTLQNST
jgi:hypothetical protein